jgi:hypothetical protein
MSTKLKLKILSPLDMWIGSKIIPTPDAFEEGNMANISPTLKIDISFKPWHNRRNHHRHHLLSREEITSYKSLFQEFWDVFAWSYIEIIILDPTIVEHHIDTWPDVTLVHQINTFSPFKGHGYQSRDR